ncbi:MAG: type II toxin-antitoxin system RelE/ParE family toxin [Bauldia sp.]
MKQQIPSPRGSPSRRQRDPSVANAIVRRIESAAALIDGHPAIGRPNANKRIRVFSVLPHPYLLFHEIDGERGEVAILPVRHSARAQD